MLARITPLALAAAGDRFRNSIHAFLYLALVVLFLSIWHAKVTGRLSASALAVFALICGTSMVWGRLFTRLAPLSFTHGCSLTLQFLCGFLVLNTLLFALSLVSPLGIANNLFILASCAVLLLVSVGRGSAPTREMSSFLPDLLCVLISGAGATLWCADALSPMVIDGPTTIFRTWLDSFLHARLISMFSQSHGLGTMHGIDMSDAPLRIYHYAVYFLPAAVSSLTGTGAYDLFASFLLPFGILLTGLAAFSLAASIWGAWPALAATVAVVLLPDAYQQGFANRYLGYNFHQQVGPAGMYGVACAAVAWIFILDGCKTGRYTSILSGYAMTAVSLAYKAHIFVANAFLVMIYPCLFFVRVKATRRVIVAMVLSALFVFVVALSQKLDGIPTLRLDGSSAGSYLSILLDVYDRGVLKDFLNHVFVEQAYPKPVLLLCAIGLLLLSTFGLWSAACLMTLVLLRKQTPAAVLCFPVLVVANYLVMSLGLAMNPPGIGVTPDDMLNRPLVWAYFVVAAWTGGASYTLLFGNGLPRGSLNRACAGIVAVSCFLFPLLLADNVQTFPRWAGYGSFAESGSFPTCLVAASRYIREHSHPDDIVQDSQNDSKLMVSALAERQVFAISYFHAPRPSGEMLERLEDLATFRKITDAAEVAEFARRRHISWYVLRPDSEVAWPAAVLDNSAFNCDGYRVYRFAAGRINND